MDVARRQGASCMGPNNYLARAYQSVPIAITVEGANILTRSMIIFGQGAIRGHPLRAERDRRQRRRAGCGQSARRFRPRRFFGHMGRSSCPNSVRRRCGWESTRGIFLSVPGRRRTPAAIIRSLTRLSTGLRAGWRNAGDVSCSAGSLKPPRSGLSARPSAIS